MDEFDADVFFKLHDLQNKGRWSKADILNLYGLARETIVGDGSGMGEHTSHNEEAITQEAKDNVVKTVLSILDKNEDEEITLSEFRDFTHNGGLLPDFGYGQGHHLDFESEYEEHHWKKYHQSDDPEVLIKHAEDIEHELLHHEHEIEESHGSNPDVRKLTQNYLSDIRLHNLAQKYTKP